jgi:hypothetical protein
MTQTSAIESRLSEAWAFLCGESCPFVQVAPPAVAGLADGDASAVLPIHSEDDLVAACRVVLSDEQVLQVATFLFGVEASDLSDADLRDAVFEACNVLGSCMAQSLCTPEPISIGCPEPEGERLSGLATQSQYRACTGTEPRLDLLARPEGVETEDQLP